VSEAEARRQVAIEFGGVPQVTQRTQEIGVRMALGASRASALWLIVRDAFTLIAAGLLVALPSVWGLRRFVEPELFGVTVLHVPTMAVAAAVLAGVGLGAALLPAWRAATLNPTEALRT
jgi:ABC-type antimicrobial peptide transport system permease subunit